MIHQKISVCQFCTTTNVVLDFIGHSESADVDEITVVDDPIHGEDDGIEMAKERLHDGVVKGGKKVKKIKKVILRVRLQAQIPIDFKFKLFLLQKKNLLRSCLRGFRCLRTNVDEDEDEEKEEAIRVHKEA